MNNHNNNDYLEDQRQIDAREEFAPRIRDILREYKEKGSFQAFFKEYFYQAINYE